MCGTPAYTAPEIIQVPLKVQTIHQVLLQVADPVAEL